MQQLDEKAIAQLISLRHELHRIAELSGKEHKTSKKIIETIQNYRPDRITEGIGGEGVAFTFDGNETGPSIVIRAELDALPIPEENEIEYRSQHPDNGHKCGHDGHMAIAVGVARYLSEYPPAKGTVHVLFQPAEETGQGAERILEDGKFEKLQPDYIFALHNLPGYPLKQVIVKEGVFASASRGLLVTLQGETSHAAHPEKGRSPALALSHLIQAFSSFPQLYTPMDKSAKMTVIQSSLGEIAFGTSPGYAECRATIRTYENELMEQLCNRAEQMVADLSRMYNLEYTTSWTEIFDATVNDGNCITHIKNAAFETGHEIVEKQTPFAWSEDFGRFTSRFKGAMFGIGAGRDHPQLHSSHYDFPDDLISSGVQIFLKIIGRISGFDDPG